MRQDNTSSEPTLSIEQIIINLVSQYPTEYDHSFFELDDFNNYFTSDEIHEHLPVLKIIKEKLIQPEITTVELLTQAVKVELDENIKNLNDNDPETINKKIKDIEKEINNLEKNKKEQIEFIKLQGPRNFIPQDRIKNEYLDLPMAHAAMLRRLDKIESDLETKKQQKLELESLLKTTTPSSINFDEIREDIKAASHIDFKKLLFRICEKFFKANHKRKNNNKTAEITHEKKYEKKGTDQGDKDYDYSEMASDPRSKPIIEAIKKLGELFNRSENTIEEKKEIILAFAQAIKVAERLLAKLTESNSLGVDCLLPFIVELVNKSGLDYESLEKLIDYINTLALGIRDQDHSISTFLIAVTVAKENLDSGLFSNSSSSPSSVNTRSRSHAITAIDSVAETKPAKKSLLTTVSRFFGGLFAGKGEGSCIDSSDTSSVSARSDGDEEAFSRFGG